MQKTFALSLLFAATGCASTAGSDVPANTAPAIPATTNAPLFQKLRELNALRDAGTITEDEYDNKRKYLIDNLYQPSQADTENASSVATDNTEQATARRQLGAAVQDVLGAPPGNVQPWKVDTAALYYEENGNRIKAYEAIVNLKRVYADDSATSVKLTTDTLTGGSPNGALPSNKAQTFTTSSGKSVSAGSTQPVTYTTPSGKVVTNGASPQGYTVPAGQLPIDPSFHDKRKAISFDHELAVDSTDRVTFGAGVSEESDVTSVSGNAEIAHDFNGKNTTVSAGANVERDSIKPLGGTPVPWSSYALSSREGDKRKNVNDVLLGITQVMSRRWLTQINYSYDHSRGYLNDPYKIISALDTQGNVLDYFYEKRPDSRTRNSIFWDNRISLNNDVIQISYRYMKDDWGIRSHTIDTHYHFVLGNGLYYEPHVRLYSQSKADFFQYFLTQGVPLSAYASADARLAEFNATTIGVKYGAPLGSSGEFNLRMEVYKQRGKGPATVPAQLQGINLYPGLSAYMIQAGFRFLF